MVEVKFQMTNKWTAAFCGLALWASLPLVLAQAAPAELTPLPPITAHSLKGETVTPPAKPKASTATAMAAPKVNPKNNSMIAGVVVTPDYVLGPDDQISIQSTSHDQVSLPSVTIPTDGKINMPFLGAFFVSGKTLPQVEKEVLARMKRDGFLRATVTATLQKTREQRVFILNTQGGTGTVDIKPGWRVSDVLAMAGGLSEVRPELTDVTLTRLGIPNPIILNLPVILRDTNSRANMVVQNGDTLRLKPRTIQISLAGSVAKPGSLRVPIGSSLVEAVALAGGTADNAALSRATLKRAEGEIIPVDLYDVLVKGKPAPNIELHEGDLLLIPEAQQQVTLQGAVGKPGYYPIQDGRTLRISELIALAGGTSDNASMTRTTVKRADGTTINIDLFKVLALNDDENNIYLEPDDIITVPEYTERIVVAGDGVRTGGYFGIAEGTSMRVLDALTKAGGLTSAPEATRITITRGMPGAVPTLKPETVPAHPISIPVDATLLYKKNDLDENVPLKNGDLIMVTSLPRTVYLSGEVQDPGAMELHEGEGLVEILARANGISDSGLASGVIVEREGQQFTVDVFDAFTTGKDVNFQLLPGDRIIVPKNFNRVLVSPGVNSPGYKPIPEDRPMTVTEAIDRAGGTRSDADLKKVVLLRKGAKGLVSEPMPLKEADQWVKASKVIMQPGDILFVPVRDPKKPNVASRILQAIPFVNIFSNGF